MVGVIIFCVVFVFVFFVVLFSGFSVELGILLYLIFEFFGQRLLWIWDRCSMWYFVFLVDIDIFLVGYFRVGWVWGICINVQVDIGGECVSSQWVGGYGVVYMQIVLNVCWYFC